MTTELTRPTHKVAVQLLPCDNYLYHLQFSLQAANPETFGYALVHTVMDILHHKDRNILTS
jgi:hypothetical protein